MKPSRSLCSIISLRRLTTSQSTIAFLTYSRALSLGLGFAVAGLTSQSVQAGGGVTS